MKAEVEDVADMYTTVARNASMTGQTVQIGTDPISYCFDATANISRFGYGNQIGSPRIREGLV